MLSGVSPKRGSPQMDPPYYPFGAPFLQPQYGPYLFDFNSYSAFLKAVFMFTCERESDFSSLMLAHPFSLLNLETAIGPVHAGDGGCRDF